MSIRNLRLLFAFAASIAGSAFAQNAHTSDFSFPLVGLAATETIGVNLINLASNPANGAAASCTGSVAFVNAATGVTIGTATPFTLGANAATSINLPFSSSGLTGRGLIRTVVATTTTSNSRCSLSFSLNTFATSTGETHLFLTGTGGLVAQPLVYPVN